MTLKKEIIAEKGKSKFRRKRWKMPFIISRADASQKSDYMFFLNYDAGSENPDNFHAGGPAKAAFARIIPDNDIPDND